MDALHWILVIIALLGWLTARLYVRKAAELSAELDQAVGAASDAYEATNEPRQVVDHSKSRTMWD